MASNSGTAAGGSVLVLGGGLAGLAAATALASHGYQVTILESRSRLGGRAGSFTDVDSGQTIDVCQHVSMGCCTNFAHFCRVVGVGHWLAPQRVLTFMTADRRRSAFRADRFPTPLHLARSFLGLHFLSAVDKLRIIYGLNQLQRADPTEDGSFADWLQQHGQTAAVVERFWELVLISALNETPQRCGLRYARKVFVDGFLSHPRAFEVQLPTVPLGDLYGAELRRWLDAHGVRLLLNNAVRAMPIDRGRVRGVELRSGDLLHADWYLAAVPFDRLLDLLPSETVAAEPVFAGLKQLETSPITSVHCWFDRPLLRLPHVVLVNCLGHWLFNRGQTATGDWYVQVVLSAARGLRSLGHEEVQRRIVAELLQLFPAAAGAVLRRARVITEQSATFSAVPGVDRWRPAQASPVENLLLAGDWTDTGWPATMEGAVRSGYLAAEALLRRAGQPQRLLQPDLA